MKKNEAALTESSSLISEEQLKAWTKYSRTADLLDFLRSNGVTYFRGRGGCVITTIQAIDSALSSDPLSNYDW